MIRTPPAHPSGSGTGRDQTFRAKKLANRKLFAGGFGQITSAADPRIGQLALNLLF